MVKKKYVGTFYLEKRAKVYIIPKRSVKPGEMVLNGFMPYKVYLRYKLF